MPAIRDLFGRRCPARYAVNILIRAVAAEYINGWMLLKPGSNHTGSALRQNVNGRTALKVNDQGSIVAALPLGPIVNADNTGWWRCWERSVAHQAEECIRTTWHPSAS